MKPTESARATRYLREMTLRDELIAPERFDVSTTHQ